MSRVSRASTGAIDGLLRAERNGSVKKINAKPGDSLAVDAVILEFV